MDNNQENKQEPNLQIITDVDMENKEYECPKYYKSNRLFPSGSIDYLTIILDDIRNYRVLNKFQLSYISKLSPEHNQTIIETYNECMKSVCDIINDA